jgi:hypothetical protein
MSITTKDMPQDPTTNVPGLRGWSAQGRPTRVALPGLRGWVAQSQPTRATQPGLRGWASTRPDNLVLTITLPPTQALADTYVPLRVEMHYGATVLRTLAYSGGGRYVLQVPPNVPLTLASISPRYVATSQELTVAPGQTAEVTIALAFAAELVPASKTRRRYLK